MRSARELLGKQMTSRYLAVTRLMTSTCMKLWKGLERQVSNSTMINAL